MAYLAMLKNAAKILDPDPEVDDFQKFNQFFLVHRYICDTSFMKIISVVLCKVASRQTDKQKRRAIHNLSGGDT